MYRHPLFLAILLAFVVLLVLSNQDDAPIQLTEPQLFKDKFYLQNFQAKGYDQQGQLNQVIHGERLNQPVATLDNHLVSPQVTLIENSQPTWELTAQKGWMDSNHEQATLEGELHLKQLNQDQLELNTDYVDLDLILKKVTTDDIVTLNHIDGRTEGTGMEADLPTATFQFNSDVESVYEP